MFEIFACISLLLVVSLFFYVARIHLELSRIRKEIPRAVAHLGASLDRIAGGSMPKASIPDAAPTPAPPAGSGQGEWVQDDAGEWQWLESGS